ncbi:MAG: DedA family protein [Prevotella sp.]|uniref:YqaA family protein n=1 Tax=Prevotella sp. P3-122 TaxID=2024223 RepID=UPI001F0A33B0|nr:VTT domain-containing protein [Prevotella sp. P3-122]MCI6182645.1 DedA family protein [Prevotella sp.]MCI6310169.1 DedA family protein [Prevotella sp.]MCI6462058.1 DedA family protein [Prevotella sp.]MCI6501350.1 DedA family protein [Prevotella sp.]MCI6554767.1 DedA family protein [Prevotella sp.]
MGALIDILIDFGYWGMLAAAFLAGSFFPFSSEAVMTALVAVGLDPVQLTIYATIGNVAGGLFNYGVGRMGRLDWIEKYLHVSKESLDKATKFMGGHGAWMGFFAFVPILGSAITICLGLMRANIIISVISITLGKFIRYAILAYILMCGQTMLA